MVKITIPLFPLNGVIFFPNSSLPLNIFEERYLEMIDFALSSNRQIGMIQLDKNEKLYKIGCVGKISYFNKTDGGRYIVNLIGKNYFKIKNELSSIKKFRMANVELKIVKNQTTINNLFNFNKDLLLNKYKNYVENQNINIDFSIIKQIENEKLIKFIAMSCNFSTEEKQMLLETYNLNELADKLISLFEFYTYTKSNNNLSN